MPQSEAGYIDARPPPPIRRNLLAAHGRTIQTGQTQKSECTTGKSALPSTTGIVSQTYQVRKVPILLQSRKSSDPENLAKVDLWTSPPLCCFSTPLQRSLVDFG